MILEEVLFNKNSKSIKKADILNRYVKDKNYSIELEFERDNTEYQIKTSRGTSQTVKLFKSGVDISAHTATATYKMIEDILGFDHKTFSQIVYQSNASSLEFLTAADTARTAAERNVEGAARVLWGPLLADEAQSAAAAAVH